MKNVVIEEWEDLECLCKACEEAVTAGGLFTDTGVNECGDDEWQQWKWKWQWQWDEKRERGEEARELTAR